MKKLLLILIALPMIGFGQNVNIPDANFKAYLVGNSLINTNGDTEIQVSEANSFNGNISCGGMNISNLTGIEDFTAIKSLNCSDNPLISLDVSQNLDLYCFICKNTLITILDLSNNPLLGFNISDNPNLSNIELRNGFNLAIENITDICYNIGIQNNQQLFCINADLPSHCDTVINTDPQNYFSTNCNGTSIQEHTTNKKLLKVTDLLGRETKESKNEVLFYNYDDGTVEKRIVIE